MGIIVDGHRLRLELIRRGWHSSDLAREAGLSEPTISAALMGHQISPHSLRQIAEAIARTPEVVGIDGLMAGENGLGLG
jgi:transcriptional regulator with XRE-family HTH domain